MVLATEKYEREVGVVEAQISEDHRQEILQDMRDGKPVPSNPMAQQGENHNDRPPPPHGKCFIL